MTIKELQETSTAIADKSGFDFPQEEIDRKLLLCVGELCEAQEELRSGHSPTEIYFLNPAAGIMSGEGTLPQNTLAKPEGFPIELADAIIRLAHLAQRLGIDLTACIEMKQAYNKTRPFRHGKAF